MARYLRRLAIATGAVVTVVRVAGLPLRWVSFGGSWVSLGVIAVLFVVLQKHVDKGEDE
ncbi:hypothetical protein [Streptomyces sp. NPDC102360]|uniref:hypothetical protein n=1 Tax=Streptomyces sp. NPDC102360 TaxID=3366160 RepID=UPI003800B716